MGKKNSYQELEEKIKAQSKTEKINSILFDIIKAVSTTTSLEEFYVFIHYSLSENLALVFVKYSLLYG